MPQTPLDHYQHLYYLDHAIIQHAPQRLTIDQHRTKSFFPKQPIYLFDVDHTILNTFALKELLSQSLQPFDITPQVWEKTYQQAKTTENFYDFHRHLELLSQLISPQYPVQAVPERIQDYLFETINQHTTNLIYPNMRRFFLQHPPLNLVIMTSGTGEWQRQKAAIILQTLNLQPQAILLVERTYKGWVIDQFYRYLHQPNLPQLIIIDDNIDELIHIAQSHPNYPISLFRPLQLGGQYNQKALPASYQQTIRQLDFIHQPNLDLFQTISHYLT